MQPLIGSAIIELPGFGVPGRRGPASGPAALAAALLRRLDTLELRDVVLLGHSASCQIVAEAAAQDPDRIAGLVMVGPTTDPRAADWPTLATRWIRTAAWERPHQIPAVVAAYRRTGLGDMLRAMDAARRHRIDSTLASVRCPVLIIRGRHDRIAPADWVDALTGPAAGRRAVTLPAGAHMVPITAPALLAGEIAEFLAGRC
jgi:pimeloyl-ACP methyl ester carboxylesterase